MMVEAFTAGKGKAEYAYNGFKNRVKKLENLQSTESTMPDPCREIRYILDMTLPYDNLLMTQGSQNQSYIWGNDLLESTGEEKFCCLQDHLGSPIRLIGDEQSDTPLAYDEFGVPVVDTFKNVSNPFGFAGYQVDDVSGLYYVQARYYEPTTSRMLSKDCHWHPGNRVYGDNPAEASKVVHKPAIHAIIQSSNLYGYCMSNPVRFNDLTGNNAAEVLRNGWILGGTVSQLDSPLPGPADAIGLVIGLGGTALAGGMLIYEGYQSYKNNKAAQGNARVMLDELTQSAIDAGAITSTVDTAEAQCTREWAYSQVNSEKIKPEETRDHTVYVIQKYSDGKIWYVGMTNDFFRRHGEHQDGKNAKYPRKDYLMVPVATGLTRNEARALEQTLIMAFTLGALNNIRNSIAKSKWDQFKAEFSRAQSLISGCLDD